MIQQLAEQLVSMGQILLALDTGVGLLVAVGFSMSASHLFSLLANRLTPRQIFLHMVVDALVLSLALLLCLISHCLMLALMEGVPLQPITFGNRMAVALWPGLFYVLVAAPYVSDLIAVTILGWMHLNMMVLVNAMYGIPFSHALFVCLPGYVIALLLVGALFSQRWRSSYDTLAKEVALQIQR